MSGQNEPPERERGREPDGARRVSMEPGGPLLVEGPVEFVAEDGTLIRSDRPVVALCTCRRSRLFPFCDTSHRRRSRPPARPPAGRKEQPSGPSGQAGPSGQGRA